MAKGNNRTNKGKGTLSSSPGSQARATGRQAKLPLKQRKRKAVPTTPKQRKQRSYTDQELGLPKLNMITPVGVQKPKGKKKGKVFVDDAVSTHTFCTPPRMDMHTTRAIRGWRLVLTGCVRVGEHDYHSCHGQCREGGPD